MVGWVFELLPANSAGWACRENWILQIWEYGCLVGRLMRTLGFLLAHAVICSCQNCIVNLDALQWCKDVAGMEKTATLNLQVNPEVKKSAEVVLYQLGVPMATAVDMFLKQITLTGGIPFAVTLPKAPESVNSDISRRLLDE